ncbi:MAG: crotonase/enoyl-CoA hydratase family protein [Shewanella sp.]|nr:crotonase/enoyl-CoA hydratase family protein [Shewanella sp.]MCF1430312.1 crotonase/enoyl-CoA hydratase family protein [Shewanella sp.]MCF1440025.1 crotonase/enoyl-CoA hydratase family protein [Shewanella sp.]MCF1459103.1 crotonase/enoyl-CoA hydratase family protein [Shewanella sp.]
MSLKYLTFKVVDGVARVTLDRPDKLNALNYQMFCEIRKVQKMIRRDAQINAVILSGAGGHFSSGLDVRSVIKRPLQVVKLLFKWLPGNANLAQQVSVGWQRLPVPVIAVIQGHCYGGGMQIALGADMRYASPDADFSIMEAKWGLVPDMAGLVALRSLLPRDKALELTLTADIISAHSAQSLGLITRVSQNPMADAIQMATKLMRTSPDAAAAIKASIHRSWSAGVRTLQARESWYQIRLLLGKNSRIAALRQTREPDKPWQPRQNGW